MSGSSPVVLAPGTMNTDLRVQQARELEEPLAGLTTEELLTEGRNYAAECCVTDPQGVQLFERAARLAAETGAGPVDRSYLPADERILVDAEYGKWSKYNLAVLLWFVAAVNALMAGVQGMDE